MPRYVRFPYVPQVASNAYAATYCERCERGFKSEYAITEHRRDSRRHWECPTCGFDADGWDDLLDHCRHTDCRSVCQGCNDGNGKHWPRNSAEYWQHVDDWNVCTDCEEHFDTPYDLEQASGNHSNYHHGSSEPDSERYDAEGYYDTDDYKSEPLVCGYEYPCLQCDRWFTSYGGMILHLESSSCSTVNDISLNQMAAECSRWREFIYADYRYDMANGCKIKYCCGPVEVYFCPTCDASMTKLSGLFQHVESASCGQTLDNGVIGTLQRFLAACF